MNFNLKTFKFLKLKKKFKKNSIIYICNTKNKSNFIKEMQYKHDLNLGFYKVNNSITKKCLKNSIFHNHLFLFSSFIMLAEVKNSCINLDKIHKNNLITSTVINNKIYGYDEKLFSIISLNYENDQKNLLKVFKNSLKTFKKIRNNVI